MCALVDCEMYLETEGARIKKNVFALNLWTYISLKKIWFDKVYFCEKIVNTPSYLRIFYIEKI